MEIVIAGERIEDVERVLAAAGYRITDKKLLRYSHHLLISKPLVRSLGRARGTERVFPYGTARRVLRLLELEERYGKAPEKLGWWLWVEGYEVDELFWREPIASALNRILRIKELLADSYENGGGLSDVGMDEIEKATTVRTKDAASGVLRRLLRSKYYISLLYAVANVLIGGFSSGSGDREQRFMFARLLGAEPAAKRAQRIRSASAVGVQPFVEMLDTLSQHFAKVDYTLPLTDEIFYARNELHILFHLFGSIADNQKHVGRIDPALLLLKKIGSVRSVNWSATLLVLWIIARQIPDIRQGASQFLH